jgi:hypothetical protein
MILTGLQKQILKDGILGAYPSENDLEILLLEKMGLSYSAKARGDNYANRVAYLVIQLEADGEVEQLIKVIVEKKPNSPYLTQVKTGFSDILTPGAVEDGQVKLFPLNVAVETLSGILHRPGIQRVSLEDMEKAISEGANDWS